MSDFTVVSSNKRVQIFGCTFCKRKCYSDWTDHNTGNCERIKELNCYFCKAKGHTANPKFCQPLADKIKRDEENERKSREHEKKMAEIVCNYCKGRGHPKKRCPKIAEKNKKLEKDFPDLIPAAGQKVDPSKGWVNIVTANREKSVVAAIEKANEDEEIKKKAEQERKSDEYLIRCEERKKRKEEKDRLYVADMERQFGCNWFNFVEHYRDGKYDSAIAANLRYEFEVEEEKREWEEDKRERKMMQEIYEKLQLEEQQEKHNRKTMTPEQFNKWYWEKQEAEWGEDDNYFNSHLNAVGSYSMYAPPEYATHAFITSQMLNYRAKPLENQKLMDKWLKEKEQNKK